VVFTGSLFVAVGTRIFTSPDAVTWTERPAPRAVNLRGVAWTGTQLVAVGEEGVVLTSGDGSTWVERSIPPVLSPLLGGVAASASRIVAVGEQQDAQGQADVLVLSSTDGVTWTAAPTIPGGFLGGVTWSGTQFVAVGASMGSSLSAPMSVTSPDGLAWTVHRLDPAVGSFFRNVVHGGSVYVAGGYPANASSPDGIAWQATPGAFDGYGLAWNGNRFLSCGYVYCHVSTDGVTWDQAPATLPGSGTLVLGLTWGNDRWVGVGNQGSGSIAVVLTSP
jgi:hypothetical protein